MSAPDVPEGWFVVNPRHMAELRAARDALEQVKWVADGWRQAPICGTTGAHEEELRDALKIGCTCAYYAVDYTDPDRYHSENMDREGSPSCPAHGSSVDTDSGSDNACDVATGNVTAHDSEGRVDG